MCRIPRIILVAPEDRHGDLRRTLSSLEYEITATVTSIGEAEGVSADVAVIVDATSEDAQRAHELSLKAVALGGEAEGAEMTIAPDEAASFKTRVWELFRPV